MNRILKKAVSFVTALAVSAALCTNAVMAAPEKTLSMSRVFSNKFPIAVGMSNATLFFSKGSTKKETIKTESDAKERSYISIPSDAKITMVTSSGSKVKIPNTIEFDRMFDICSGYYYNTIPVSEMYYESRGPVIAVGDGKKYNVLLENGKFLNEKTMYDSVSYSGGVITAVNGNKSTYFTTSGKKLLALENNKYGSAVCYSNTAKQIVFGKSNAKEDWKVDYTVTDFSGKVIKTFKALSAYCEFSYIKGKDGKTYLFRDESQLYGGKSEYFDLTGKKVKESTVVGTYELSASYDDKCKFTVKNSSGSVLLSIDGTKISSGYTSDSVSDAYAVSAVYSASGDYLYVVTSSCLYVYNRAKGELIDKNLEHSYCLSVEATDGGKSAILTLSKKIESDWGSYMASEGRVVYTLSTKKLSEKYEYISPLYSESSSSSKIAYLTKENGKYGFLNSIGDVALKPSYKNCYYADANVALMDNGKTNKLIINPQTGGYIPSTKDKTKATTVIPAECIVHKNDWSYYEYAPRSVQPLGKKYYRIITSDSKGKKFGLVIIKYK